MPVGRKLHTNNMFLFLYSRAKNCSRLYADFLWAFSGRSPCDVPIDRYINYTKAAAHPIESDKVSDIHEYSVSLTPKENT